MTQISFDPKTIGTATANEECAEVSSTGGNNALPLVVRLPARPDAGVKVLAFTNVERGELALADLSAGDVDAATREVHLRGRVHLKLVAGSAGSDPGDKTV